MPKLAIIGAGPIGIEAALAGLQRGWSVRVYERDEIAANVKAWGHVRMFSPFSMNASAEGIARLEACGFDIPKPDDLLTGRAFCDSYVEPLAACLGHVVETHTEVLAIARHRTLKGEKIADPSRRDRPFRLLVRHAGAERADFADVVFDCSGTFHTPNRLGDGGIPAIGERACRSFIDYGVPDVAGKKSGLYEHQRVLVVGAGHSAATVVRDLNKVTQSILWTTRGDSAVRRISKDPLPARDEVLESAEALIASGKVEHRPRRTVLAVERIGNSLKVTLATRFEEETVEVDRIVAAVGFRPDLEIARELQARTCYATEGSYSLAAHLLGETGGDCLAVGNAGPETLLHPEPDYFTLGMKSYGRSPDFLLRTGREQIVAAFSLLQSPNETAM